MKRFFIFFIYIFLTFYLFSANINVDELNLISISGVNSQTNKFEMNTYFKFLTSFDGGYKFAAKVGFEANVTQLAKNYLDSSTDIYNKVFLIFNNAEITARNLIESRLDLSFWSGTYRYLGEGNYYRGFLYFPENQNVDYKGMYRIRGSGITTILRFWEDKFKLKFHLYQNTNFVTSLSPTAFNYFSFDTEIGLFLKYASFELFGGYTKDFIYPNESSALPYGRGKVGLTFWTGDTKYIEFFSTVGISTLDNNTFDSITNGTISAIDALYISAELHFKLFVTDHIISFLTKPYFYNEQVSNEKSDFNINYRFNVSVSDSPLNGGFIFNFTYSLKDPTDTWNLYLSPYISIKIAGVIWDIHVHYDFSRIDVATRTGNNMIALEGLKLVLGVSSSF